MQVETKHNIGDNIWWIGKDLEIRMGEVSTILVKATDVQTMVFYLTFHGEGRVEEGKAYSNRTDALKEVAFLEGYTF